MSIYKAKLLLSREQNGGSRQDLSMSKTEKQGDFLDSSIKSSSDVRQLVNIFREFIQNSKKQAAAQPLPAHAQDLEPRDRPITVPLPAEEPLLPRESLERYMTNLCGAVWSRAFYYYSTNQLSLQNTKIYSSQQILENLSRLCEKYALQAQDFSHINEHLQGNVLEYMLSKYPMTLSQEINRNLNNSVREFDDSDNIAHNYLHSSPVHFKHRQAGEYNDLIMRTINEAVTRIETRLGGQTVYQKFQEKMTLLFQSVGNYEWMHHHSEEGAPEEDIDAQILLTVTLNNSLKKKYTMDENLLKNQYIKIKEKEKSTYEEKVKQYTHYKIGKKLPESARLFTDEEINSHRLKIESPQVLRILTKWCQQLEKKYTSTSSFEHYIESVSLEKSNFVSMMLGQARECLSQLIQEEKEKIQQELAQLASNNFFMQSELLMRKLLEGDYTQMDRFERISAQFSIGIVNNLHSYIIAYLNRLIHGLLSVAKRFEKLPVSRTLNLPLNSYSIITFQVMDLIRCKCSSKEKEILRIYKEIMKLCDDSESMELVRVVNRLRKGTNDILINVKYHGVLCEIQLAVTSTNNIFLEYSNSFNHYLYELKRSVFGPLTELSSIWKSLDNRFNVYQSLEPRQQGDSISTNHRCNSECSFLPYNRPFICNLCSQHYFHNKFVKRHLKCKECDFWMCARCQIKRSDCVELLGAGFHDQDIIKRCKKVEEGKEIPEYGICIYIQSQEIVIEPFRKYTQKSSEKIMGIKNKHIYQIYDTSNDKLRQKFISKFIIFQIQQEFAKKRVKITNEAVKQYLTEEKLKHLLARNKDTINLNNQALTDEQLERLTTLGTNDQKNRIKNIELIGNMITNCNHIAQQFQNVLRLDVSKNRIDDFSNVKKMRRLQKIVVNDNRLKEFPLQICEVLTIKEIFLNDNNIQSIPSALSKCRQLISLHMSGNQLRSMPGFIFELSNLAELNLTSNKIVQIPTQISLAKKLKCLSMQNNYLESIPREIEILMDLQRLNLSHNKISQIPSFASLRSLKHLNLKNNDIKNIDQLLSTPLNLRQVDLSHNYIQEAHTIDSFNVLRFLNLSSNLLTTFPRFGRACSNLKYLLMSDNKISKMGTFENLINLEQVQLSNNLFEEVHPSLSKLDYLSIIHIEGNQLKHFSNIYLDHVVKLSLRRNKIGQVRGLHMKNIQELDISQNELSSFEFNFLPKLKKLNLNINNLKTLELSSYHKMSVLQVANNQLASVPTFHSNNQLKFLNLEHNYIQEIPRPMLASSHINTLNLSNNKIKIIPKDLQNLSNIKNKSLFLEKNPLETIECLNFITNKCGPSLLSSIKCQDKSGFRIGSIVQSQTMHIAQ